MAAIVISSPSGAQTNPTNYYVPYNNGGEFFDSIINQNDDGLLFTVSSTLSLN